MSMNFLRHFTLLGCLVFSFMAYALPNDKAYFNCQSKNILFKNNEAILNSELSLKKPQIYLIKSNSSAIVLLDHVKKDAGVGAGWASVLNPDHWSAISIMEKNFALRCMKKTDNGFKKTNCDILQICQLPARSAKSKHQYGDYWIVEDKTWHDLTKSIR